MNVKSLMNGCILYLKQTFKPGTLPDFILKLMLETYPVCFFVHKRPHVDYFLDVRTYFPIAIIDSFLYNILRGLFVIRIRFHSGMYWSC